MNIADSLRAKMLKATPQREAIVKLLQEHGHFTVDDLYVRLKITHPSISLATVYKNMRDMVEKGFLLEVAVPNQKSWYELRKESHAHQYCRKCGKITDIPYSSELELPAPVENVKYSTFQVESVQIVYNGICSECDRS